MTMKYTAQELYDECRNHQERYDAIKRHLQDSKVVIDLGAGAGNLAEQLKDKTVECYDIRKDYVAYMKDKGLNAGLWDAADTAVPDFVQGGDTVVLAEVLEHCENPGSILKNAFDIASERVVITLPAKQQNDPDHRWNVFFEQMDCWIVLRFERVK